MSGNSEFSLTQHAHGKSRVRVLKRSQKGNMHEVLEITVNVMLWGNTEHSFTKG
jgi:hypothetical protein